MITKLNNQKPQIVNFDNMLSANFFEEHHLLVLKGWPVFAELDAKYKEIFSILKEHLETHKKLRLIIAYELFNTVTAKFIFDTIKMINNCLKESADVTLNWIVKNSNQDMVDSANDFRAFCDFPFELTITD